MDESINKPNEHKENKENMEHSKIFIVDTAYFIQLKTPITEYTYYTTNLIVDEIRDEKAREFYNLHQSSFIIKNPSKESIKEIVSFAKKSNDLFNLSIPDLSILALSYELSSNLSSFEKNPFPKEPQEWKIKKREKPKKEEPIPDEEGFIEVKSKKKNDEDENNEDLWSGFDKDEEWINDENISSKLLKYTKVEDVLNDNKEKYEKDNKLNRIFLISDDFTIQNVCLKIGIKVISVNGLLIRRVKNYLFKCLTCSKFNFDTTVLFCQECGYPSLMKIGFSVNDNGKGVIYDKDPDLRVRGTKFDLPKPTVGKKSTVYILCEDQLPKKKDFDIEKHLDKILDNYEQYKDLLKKKVNGNFDGQSTKNFEWGYPKKNPNISKKYYGKKGKK